MANIPAATKTALDRRSSARDENDRKTGTQLDLIPPNFTRRAQYKDEYDENKGIRWAK
jgi:hypothetical protein